MTTTIADTPFQIWFFLTASFLNLLIGIFGIAGSVINWGVRIFASESALLNQQAKTGQPMGESLQEAVDSELKDLSERQPLGKVIGILERELYLYAMVTQVHAFVGAILLFKAFSGWLSTYAAGSTDAKSMKTLARFYSYAIGNFVSLILALSIFEVIRWLIQSYPLAKRFIWISL